MNKKNILKTVFLVILLIAIIGAFSSNPPGNASRGNIERLILVAIFLLFPVMKFKAKIFKLEFEYFLYSIGVIGLVEAPYTALLGPLVCLCFSVYLFLKATNAEN